MLLFDFLFVLLECDEFGLFLVKFMLEFLDDGLFFFKLEIEGLAFLELLFFEDFKFLFFGLEFFLESSELFFPGSEKFFGILFEFVLLISELFEFLFFGFLFGEVFGQFLELAL